MYIDIDSRGTYSIAELSRSELNLLQRALSAYVRYNLGHLDKNETSQINKFDYEFKNVKNEKFPYEKQKVDKG